MEDKKFDIVLTTTACSRSELHKQVLSDIPSFLSGYNCKWIIRIDSIEEDADVTKQVLEDILDYDHIDLDVYVSGNNAGRISWYESTKFCINKAFEYKSDIGYFWLEDDWKLDTTSSLGEIMPETANDNYYISLAGRNVLNFNPCIWSSDLFEKYMVNKINSAVMPPDGGNAERACTYNKGGAPESTSNINMHDLNIFHDIGREWARKKLSGKRTFHL